MGKYKALIYILIGLVLTAALTYFIFIPQIGKIFLLFLNNTIKKEEVAKLEQEKANINNLKKEKQETEKLSDILSSMLPTQKEAGAFMIEIEALAASSNIDFSDIKFSEEKKTAPKKASSEETSVKGATTAKIETLIFEMTAKGSYPDMVKFLQGLEKINRAISIERCDLSESKGLIQANIKGKAYYKNG